VKKRNRKKKSGGFRRRAQANSVARKAKALRASMRGMTAQRLYLDRGGYADKGRSYFGRTGVPVYRVYSADGNRRMEVRASSAYEAKAKALYSRPDYADKS
jgi:hypothetical protein